MLDLSQEDNLFVEFVKTWVLGGNSIQDLCIHCIESFNLHLELLFFNVIASFSPELLDELLSEVGARL